MERANDPEAKFESVVFDLATGAKIRVQIDEFWEQLSDEDLRNGHQPKLYFAARIYSDEETNPRRLVKHTEFRAGNDFDQSCLPRLTVWSTDLAVSRHRFTYDCVEDFLEEFSVCMEEFSTISDDMADYIYKAHGLKPRFEDPPHAEFAEDQVVRRPPRIEETGMITDTTVEDENVDLADEGFRAADGSQTDL